MGKTQTGAANRDKGKRRDRQRQRIREPEVLRINLLGGFRVWLGSEPVEETAWR